MTSETITLIYPDKADRLDKVLAQALPQISRSQAKALIEGGHVQATGRDLKPKTTLPPGTILTVTLPQVEKNLPRPENIPLEVLFEDEYLLAINKPAGLVVHPGAGRQAGTLVNALLYHYPDLAALQALHETRPGIVHRLDRDTSGVIVVARAEASLTQLQAQFKARQVEKIYLTLVHGQPGVATGLIDAPIGRHPQHRQRMAVLAQGRSARTRYKILQKFDGYSLLEVNLETGRTHQIRVHLNWLKYPVVGDKVYGRRRERLPLKRQFLHASRLKLKHPHIGTDLVLEAPLADDLQAILDLISAGS